MPAGIIIYNDAGTVLLDDTYPNMTLRAKGSVTIGAGGSSVVTVSGATASARMAWRSSSPVFSFPGGGGNGSWTVYAPEGAVVDWYCFDKPIAGTSTFGLCVYDSTGALTFEFSSAAARIRAAINATTQAGWATTFTYDTGKTYAVMFQQAAFLLQTIYTPAGATYPANYYFQHVDRYHSSAAVSGASVTFSLRKTFTGVDQDMPTQTPTQRPDRVSNAMSALILDVTGQ